MSAEAADPQRLPRRLVDTSVDVRAAVLVDAAGNLVASSEDDPRCARALADLTRRLVEAADGADGEPAEQIEAQIWGGGVFAVRSARHTLACVTRRLALSALVLYDLRQSLIALERPA